MQQTPNFESFLDSIRSIMKSSIEQARKAFDSFVATSENMLHGFDTSANPVADSLKNLNEKGGGVHETKRRSQFQPRHAACRCAPAQRHR